MLLVGSLGVAASRSIAQLIAWRFIQALGASPGLAVGSGVIGDIYKLEERGQALGVYFAVSISSTWLLTKILIAQLQAVLLGPALAPLVGGIAAHYFSWRLLQAALGGVGLLVWLLTFSVFPETYHPGERGADNVDPATLSRWRPVILNPFDALWILRSPNMLAVVSCSTTKYILIND
jgi:MFS family permease